jgi:hypothetical protein
MIISFEVKGKDRFRNPQTSPFCQNYDAFCGRNPLLKTKFMMEPQGREEDSKFLRHTRAKKKGSSHGPRRKVTVCQKSFKAGRKI